MTEETPRNTPGQDPAGTVFCPRCDYNLTGLSEPRCPECGRGFDRDRLLLTAERGPRPIGVWETVRRLSYPGVAFSLSPLGPALSDRLDFPAGFFISATVVFVSLLVLVAYGVINCSDLARRLAVTRAARSGHPRSGLHDRLFITLCAIGLYLCQLALGVAGFVACVALIIWLSD